VSIAPEISIYPVYREVLEMEPAALSPLTTTNSAIGPYSDGDELAF
jgi:hypothetical protein